ncbi:hypothetical protein F5Y16DRAFT_99084 [Xylariaceae sp. FL0255]|nr:hypothetical protein F5Y16DRAFT_99084 [Xylariaceae sp. FL0255]
MMQRLHYLVLLLLGVLASCTAAASAPTFCKCTCFKNSTLIQLGPDTITTSTSATSATSATPLSLSQSQPSSSSSEEERAAAEARARARSSSSCTQCTRAFCLSQSLSICADAEETDVLATCFQRDSRKDQIIVWGFILGTTGLLGWAAAKRVAELRADKRAMASGLGAGIGRSAENRDRGVYAPVSAPS